MAVCREAGRDAQRRYANVDALEQYQFALEAAAHLELDSGQVAQVAEALGDVADLAARYDDAESAYARARDLYGGDVGRRRGCSARRGMYASVGGGTTKRWIGSGTGSTPSNVPVPREDW